MVTTQILENSQYLPPAAQTRLNWRVLGSGRKWILPDSEAEANQDEWRPILGLLAIGALALVLSALGGGGEVAGAPLLPACPETWPEATGWHDGWYVIIDRDSNGNKHGRAYPADSGYQSGYVPGAPHEICIVRIKDNPGVEQLSFGADRDRTQTTPVAGAGAPGNQGDAGSVTPTPPPETAESAAFSISAAVASVEGQPGALTLTLSGDAPDGGAAFAVTPHYGGNATATADDVGTVISPVTVPGGETTVAIIIPTVDDAVDENDEIFTVSVAATTAGWTKAGDDRDTATVTITDDDTSGVTVNAADPVRVDEGAAATYTVSLTSRPTADVTITAVSADAGAAAVEPATRTFTPSGWNTPQTFTLRGVADDDTSDESVGISHRVASADGKYANLPVSSVRVAVSDTTSPGQQGSGGEPPPAQSTPTPTPTPTPAPTDTAPSPSGSGNSCPNNYEHDHDSYGKHWHQWSINDGDGQCVHNVGHNEGGGYHEH